MPGNFNDADRERLTRAYVDTIEQRILPAYRTARRISHEDEYLGSTRKHRRLVRPSQR